MKILFKTVRFILDVLPKRYRLKVVGIAALLFLNSILELLGLGALIPVFSVLLEDNVIEKYVWAQRLYTLFNLTDEKQLIVLLAAGLLFLIIIKNIISLWILKINSTFSLGLYKDFAIRLHKFYYKKGFTYFKSTNSNVVVRDLKTATNQFSTQQVLGSLNLLNEMIVLIFIIVSIAIYNAQILAILIVTVVPPFLIFYRWVSKRSVKLGEISNRISPIVGKNMFQSIFGYVDVIITGAENEFRKRIKENLDELVEVDIKTNIYNLAPTRIIETSLMLAIAVIVSFGIYYLPSKTELLKLLGLFAIAGYRIMPSINRIMIAINGLNRTQWIFGILAPLKNEDQIKNKKDESISFKEHLKLDHISFSYKETAPIFKDYCLRIKKGEVVGLIGPSGSGKTTLMNILLGFLKPTSGQYLIDDTPLDDVHLKSFYKKVGYVQQQVYLIDGTIAENVAFGCRAKDIDQTKLKKVLEKASLLEMVNSLPNGVNERIGENGTKLSGGQRQRVGIARALYFDIEILFFDEATSSLDSETENEITQSIKALSDGQLTIIIIAHRMSTLEHCNRIIEVDGIDRLEIK